MADKVTIASCIANIAANDASREAWLDKLRPLVEAKGWDREKATQELRPLYAKARGVELIIASRGTRAGEATFDQKDARSERARRAFDRLMVDLFDGASASAGEGKPDLLVPPEIAKLAAKLVAMCNEYEEAKRLANIAVAKAFAAK